ncbi:MAG: Uma2 family endonuclease [Polaribacter sp.]
MVITDINQLDFNKKYTYADYLLWQFSERVELIRGKIFKMSPAPKRIHQKLVSNLHRDISNFVKRKNCEVYIAPFDVRLSKKKKNKLVETVVQPDICVICDSSKLDERGCLGAPDLIVEVLSRSTSKKDLNEKKELYEENGVKEYWVVHPTEATLIQFILLDGKYESKDIYTEGNILQSDAINGLHLDLTEIFED